MALDKYSQLKIAGNVLGFTMREFAQENETYPQIIKEVCEGKTTSQRLSESIDKKIAKAERIYDKHRNNKLANANA